jgi:type II secretory pathway pseudopilin PulG
LTLIEIMLVLLLISLIGAYSLRKLPRLLKEQQFERSLDLLMSKIQLAQEFMLSYRKDIILQFLPSEKGMLVLLKPQQPLMPHLQKGFNRNILLKGIEQITFEEQSPPFELCFDASLGLMPVGSLTCASENLSEAITLKGFPSPLKKGRIKTYEQTACPYPEILVSPP